MNVRFTHPNSRTNTLGSQIHEDLKIAQISYEFNLISTVSLSLELSSHLLLTMSQQTMSRLSGLASHPYPAADTFAQHQALPVAHHQFEEATYLSGALGVDDVVGWAASLDPSPHVIHMDLRSPTCNSYLGGRAWATTLWRELRCQPPPPNFCISPLNLPA